MLTPALNLLVCVICGCRLGLSCCPEDDYGYGGDNLIDTPTLTVGTCQVTDSVFDPIWVVPDRVLKVDVAAFTW